jgi:hypothetical protein
MIAPIGEGFLVSWGFVVEVSCALPGNPGTPDFLSRVAASINRVSFSLRRTTCVVAGVSGEVGNPGTPGSCDFFSFPYSLWPESSE